MAKLVVWGSVGLTAIGISAVVAALVLGNVGIGKKTRAKAITGLAPSPAAAWT